jgi:hypothetical protein
MALTDAEQREILERLRGPSKARGYDMLQSIESMVTDVQVRIRGTHPAMDSLQVIQYLLKEVSNSILGTPKALVTAIAERFPNLGK